MRISLKNGNTIVEVRFLTFEENGEVLRAYIPFDFAAVDRFPEGKTFELDGAQLWCVPLRATAVSEIF